jgi:heme oxygenase
VPALKHAADSVNDRALRFFLSWGEKQSALWRELLNKLESLCQDEAEAIRVERSAVMTFKTFEPWMAGWRTDPEASN